LLRLWNEAAPERAGHLDILACLELVLDYFLVGEWFGFAAYLALEQELIELVLEVSMQWCTLVTFFAHRTDDY